MRPGGREDDTVRHWQAESVAELRRSDRGHGIELHNETSLHHRGSLNGIGLAVFTQDLLEHFKDGD